MIAGEITSLSARDVGGISPLAGTFPGSARSVEFTTRAGQKEAVCQLQALDIEPVIVIGGNGSQQSAHVLSRAGLHVAGIASTIDSDLTGSDVTIGVDTALNIALEAIDRLLAPRLGVAAMESLVEGKHGVLTGWIDGRMQWTPLSEVAGIARQLDLRLLDMAGMLSR